MTFLAYPQEVLTALDEIKNWLHSRDWYAARNIPWRRGWLISGEPGTGKTSLVRAAAQVFDLPILVADLATMRNDDFQRYLDVAKACSPSIALLEDIDTVFSGRKNIAVGEKERGLTFDCFLNGLSGIESLDGVFSIITTNRPEHLDTALIAPDQQSDIPSRPGRVDRVVKLGKIDKTGRQKIAALVLSECREEVDRIIQEGCEDTAAQFQERCQRVALKRYWAEKDKHVETNKTAG